MKLKSVRVEGFKAIKSCEFDFTDVTMLVGTNNAGKSSVLQAIHLASRSINQAYEANKQSTLSLSAAEYVPSNDYRELAHNAVWGNVAGTPESKISFVFGDPSGGPDAYASVVLKSARNEGISVKPSLDPKVIGLLRAKESIFSAYIPGIAGIPLSESQIPARHIYRKAASGDSNVVLRNILLRIAKKGHLTTLLDYVRDIYPGIILSVDFDEEQDYLIRTLVAFGATTSTPKPLEFCGAGFIHVLQIFSYLVLFKPKILLIDEPECHLHPTLQTKLVASLQRRAAENGAVALITTHSPFVARGLSIGSRTVWLDKGAVVATSSDSTIRSALGWGALDKSILMCTEDGGLQLLKRMIDQEVTLMDKVAPFPFDGVSKLGSASALVRLREALGNHHKVVIHRDRDCMTDDELKGWRGEYSKPGLTPWVTRGSDMEMYFCEVEVISAALGVPLAQAQILVDEVLVENEADFKKTFENKRSEINKRLYEKSGGSPSTEDLWAMLPYTQRVKGKALLPRLREKVKGLGMDDKKLGVVPAGTAVADDLTTLLCSMI